MGRGTGSGRSAVCFPGLAGSGELTASHDSLEELYMTFSCMSSLSDNQLSRTFFG